MKRIFTFVTVCMFTVFTSFAQGWPANYGGVMLQSFIWDDYNSASWVSLKDNCDEYSKYFDLIWVPQSGYCGGLSMGYNPVYWLDQHCSFGSEEDLRSMIAAYKAKGTGIIADVVVNHKGGVSNWVNFPNESRTVKCLDGTIKTYNITWGTGSDADCCKFICTGDDGGKCAAAGYTPTGAADTGDDFDGCRDLDHTSFVVQENIQNYLDFLINYVGYTGFRYDMVKGFAGKYVGQYNATAKPQFSVGECWDENSVIRNWIEATKNGGADIQSGAFDFQFKYRMNEAFGSETISALNSHEALISISSGAYQRYAITFCDNHDTGRDNNKLTNNWSAANAYMLASPGTPCVWMQHYIADSININHMIIARKAAGLTNTGTTIVTSELQGPCFVYQTRGTNGDIYIQFGSSIDGYPAPSGFRLVAKGDYYKFYCTSSLDVPDYKEPEIKVYTPFLDSADEISCFFETNSVTDAPYVWIWDSKNDNVNYTGGSWPGQAMTKMGQTSEGKNIFKWTYSGTLTDVPTNIIFCTGSAGNKYWASDLGFVNHGYWKATGSGTPSSTITQVGPTAINEVTASLNPQPSTLNRAFNLSGQQVGRDYHGIVIINGKKVVR